MNKVHSDDIRAMVMLCWCSQQCEHGRLSVHKDENLQSYGHYESFTIYIYYYINIYNIYYYINIYIYIYIYYYINICIFFPRSKTQQQQSRGLFGLLLRHLIFGIEK